MTEPPGPARAPGWVEEPSGLPPGGPARWWRGPEGVVMGGPPRRIAEALQGWERLGPHPARPALRGHGEDWLLLEPLGPPPAEPCAVVAAWPRGRPTRLEGRVSELLEALPGQVRVDRALAKVGLKRKAIDRLLASPVEAWTSLGPGLGGVHGGWLRQAEGRVVALRWSRASPESWRAMDLAATGLMADRDLSAAHAEGLPTRGAELAYRLACLRILADEASLGQDPAHGAALLEVAERLAELAAPAEVTLHLEAAPPWFDPSPWIPEGGRCSAAEARRVLHLLQGLHLGGQALRLRCDPPLRLGARPPQREDRLQRRRRLFSRWSEGVQVDDEGLLSATPEALAERLSQGIRGRVLDGTCGVGAWTIALARRPQVTEVVAADLHAGRLEMARHNARLYGVEDRIRFVHAPAAEALALGPFDAMVLDPPWGGRGYDREALRLEDLGMELRPLLEAGPPRVALKLPRSFVTDSLPGPWRWQAMADARGVIKLLEARRAC
ncbi:MAG: methyltransferase [Alphaproteobacteria bacterium]|nr:methyltransferase [Alphaproteobacteria bacterium]